ncbi:uncharacterized protein LOC123528139 [Mercenaria mercenaria]|uniref:uncharacterized protein LOC123528139 n=1 Tax=Mercenaria mercenaria TaxID=6596 RepID=UPI001E1D66C1|nr:uncharacterized protein LOC123528139 [Mercenaria mercenaria]
MELSTRFCATLLLKDMYFHMGKVIPYGLLALWYMSQMTIAQLRPASRYHIRSNLDWPALENNGNFFIPISERFKSVRHAQENGLLRGLKKVRERMLSERSDVLPWSCNCKHFWRDLGNGFNPRFIRDGACSRKTCWFGHFECVPQKYEINVLGRLDILEDQQDYSAQLSDDYAFVTLNVTVNCMCMRASSNG